MPYLTDSANCKSIVVGGTFRESQKMDHPHRDVTGGHLYRFLCRFV